jgi:hypothetical protein
LSEINKKLASKKLGRIQKYILRKIWDLSNNNKSWVSGVDLIIPSDENDLKITSDYSINNAVKNLADSGILESKIVLSELSDFDQIYTFIRSFRISKDINPNLLTVKSLENDQKEKWVITTLDKIKTQFVDITDWLEK